ncbi:hypothetical protein Tsubulata_029495 [Turnera subulata]|uniref:RWP-RK domain-containing protein n=1 Tax=Turnera subulata TaxID=218843 RepID=A0A9Q0FJI7_9ROSI|nr:hypothetical protein Tsubulata_029495 [Turnera subulata]
MDLDIKDELLFRRCWLETANEFNHLEPAQSFSTVLYDSSQYLPLVGSGHFSMNSLHHIYQEETEKFNESSPQSQSESDEFVMTENQFQTQNENIILETSELGGGCWDESPCSVTERLMLAVGHLREFVEYSEILIQIWVPVERGGKTLLTTIDQPYSVNPKCKSLESYRNVSKTFHFTAENDFTDSAGLPGRAFLGKLPEWSPDVRFFRSDECPRRSYAYMYNISGCLALPVFGRGSGTCLAVVEIVTTTQKISYHLELEVVCKALEAVDLKSSQDFLPPRVKEFYQVAVPEISEILQSTCKTHRLPLALTWAPCVRQVKSGCEQFDEKGACYFSVVDSACLVADRDLLGFQEACSEQFLSQDQGIVGGAFTRMKQCFAPNISSFSKTQYPLSHHARMFNLHAAIAIPLRNIYTGKVECVLELFFPKDCQDINEQRHMWDLLAIVIQEACCSFQVIMDKDFETDMVADSDARPNIEGDPEFVSSPSQEGSLEELSFTPQVIEAREKENFFVSWDSPKEEPEEEVKQRTQWDKKSIASYYEQAFPEFRHLEHSFDNSVEHGQDFYIDWNPPLSSRKATKRKKTKTEKTVSLQVLRQYFAGSLKDAAKSIGVCPTTLKRICRQHGIDRWPSRKIKKVSHTLRKLQVVVDSVQGAKGLLQIDSFYTTFPELSSPKISTNSPSSSFKINDNNTRPNCGLLTDTKPLSISCGQNSGFSFTSSRGTKEPGNTLSGLSTGHASAVEDPVAALKRTCTQAQGNLEFLPSLEKNNNMYFVQEGGAFRVKATFGEENIRFSLQPNWGLRELQQEIAKRFNMQDFRGIDLKYVDNDQESVLLTCDDDLEECKDLFRCLQNHTIKMSLHRASSQQQNLRKECMW